MTKEQSDLIKKCFAKGVYQTEIPIKEADELAKELIKVLDTEI